MRNIFWKLRRRIGNQKRGREFAESEVWKPNLPPDKRASDLEKFFDNHKSGPGIWKWRHYFDIYDRHLSKFRGKPVTILEIGVYSGGSLLMWHEYLGRDARIVGVDIEPSCKSYESEGIRIFIGDQANRQFWADVRSKLPPIDIVIDDGGHHPEQQAVTMEELLPYMAPGGVFLCEDIHGRRNYFASMVLGMVDELNNSSGARSNRDMPERRIVSPLTGFQKMVDGVHLYPFVAVVELRSSRIDELVAPKHGTVWEPFLT